MYYLNELFDFMRKHFIFFHKLIEEINKIEDASQKDLKKLMPN